MKTKMLILVVCLKAFLLDAAPVQLPMQLMQPSQSLQQQLMGLQHIQMLNKITPVHSPFGLNSASPILLFVPNIQPNPMAYNDINLQNPNGQIIKNGVRHKSNNDDKEDKDTVIINAETDNAELHPERAVLLIPNRARWSIGGVISAIPFLPIEVNVPDTISWIYDGISGIIGGIGQRLPFRRPPEQTQSPTQDNLRLVLRQQENQNILPILVLPVPIDAPIVSNVQAKT